MLNNINYIITMNKENVIIRKKLQLKQIKDINGNTIIHKNIPETSKIKIKLKDNRSPIDKLNNYLNINFKHNLMYLKDTWADVKYKYQIDSNGKEGWWDLEMLLIHFAEQLNAASMSNPSPQWPSNPFNRIPYSKIQLLELGKHLVNLKLKINCILKQLILYLNEKIGQTLLINKFPMDFMKFIETKYRYQLLNNKDSQGNYIGHWVMNNTPLSLFENRYKEYLLITPSEYDSDDDELVETDEYNFYLDILNHMPKETSDFSIENLEILMV